VEVRDGLRAMGHKVEIITGHARGLFGRAQAIQRLPDGIWAGGSDGRADGHCHPQI
jgi:gamma-glutamyltranspeptidase/glutathione hydrolase